MSTLSLSQTIYVMVSDIRRKLSQAIKKDSGAILKQLDRVASGFKALEWTNKGVALQAVADWLSPLDFPAQQSDFIGRRQKGTGQWFLDSTEFAKWRKEPKQTLFCPGIPGAGKTMVSAIVIDTLLEENVAFANNESDESIFGLAYIFLKYNDRKDQTSLNLVGAILKQLLMAKPSLQEHLETLYKKHSKQGTKPSLDNMYQTLSDIVGELSTVYIIVDAFDECDTRGDLITRLRHVQENFDLRIMVTSRFIPDIEEQFVGSSLFLQIDAKKEDVRSFVRGQLHRLPRCVQRQPELQDMVEQTISNTVGGMFLLARLHIDLLLDKRTPKAVKSVLEALPKGTNALEALDLAYKEAVKRIEGQLDEDCNLAKRVLLWITYAERPLTTDELCCALGVEEDEEELDEANILDPDDLVSVCAGLVTIDEETSVIRLVHYTTQRYFEDLIPKWIPEAQKDIASTCIRYLSFKPFRSGDCLDRGSLLDRLESHNFLNYAAKHWDEHVRTIQSELVELSLAFLLDDGAVSCAFQLRLDPRFNGHNILFDDETGSESEESSTSEDYEDIGDEIKIREDHKEKNEEGRSKMDENLANEGGEDQGNNTRSRLLIKTSKSATKEREARDFDPKPEPRHSKRANGFHLAAYCDLQHLIKALIVRLGKDLSAMKINGGDPPPTIVAILQGHDDVLELLVENGANASAIGKYPICSALHALAWNGGSSSAVDLLLRKGADIEAVDDKNRSPLEIAFLCNEEHLVDTFLERGASTKSPRKILYYAIESEDEKLMLKAFGLDVDTAARFGHTTALHLAAEDGYEELAEALIQNGCDIDARDNVNDTPLQSAAIWGYPEIVKLLIRAGATLDLANDEGRTALHSTIYVKQFEITRLLVERGANLEIPTQHGSTALDLATEGEHWGVAEFLLQHGANPRGGGDDAQWNPLCDAIYCGKEHLSKLLIQKGANIDARIKTRFTPLILALSHKREETARCLIEHGADIHFIAADGHNALTKAVRRKCDDIAIILIDKGADIRHNVKRKGTALHFAAENGATNVLKLLLEKGAEVDAKAKSGLTPLARAMIADKRECVKLLIDAGATSTLESKNGRRLDGTHDRDKDEKE